MSQSKKILVADDETHILNVVSLKLRNAGFEVICAHDGEEAVQLARESKPDLMIVDFHMPGLNGLEVCQTLKAEGIETPALMLSARGYHLTPEELGQSGIRQMMSKPFSPRELLETVNNTLAA